MFECKFCGKVLREKKTLSAHMCEQKRRWVNKDSKYVRLGFLAYNRFFQLTTQGGKKKLMKNLQRANITQDLQSLANTY